MLLSFDVAADAVVEHDHWHTVEHLPERLAIPGFLRGTRWVAVRGRPRYLVLYEVEALSTLTSSAYRERLDHPTAWTARMMPHYRGMRRGFCRVSEGCGAGLGRVAAVWRFKPLPRAEATLRAWVAGDLMPTLARRPGLGGAFLLESALAPQMTQEQQIRGADGAVDWVLVVTAYRDGALADLAAVGLAVPALAARGATQASDATYQIDYVLTAGDAMRAANAAVVPSSALPAGSSD